MRAVWEVLCRGYDVLWVRGLGRLLSMILIAPILAYQKLISPVLPPSCRYHPSCSHYAVGSLWVHGPFKGLALGTWRIGRCNPWSGGGLDPVPSRGRWVPDILPDGSPRPPRRTRTPSPDATPTISPGA